MVGETKFMNVREAVSPTADVPDHASNPADTGLVWLRLSAIVASSYRSAEYLTTRDRDQFPPSQTDVANGCVALPTSKSEQGIDDVCLGLQPGRLTMVEAALPNGVESASNARANTASMGRMAR